MATLIKDLVKIIHYIIPRVIKRNFKDEDGNEIENKFWYFKNAIISNINKLNTDIENLWGEEEQEYIYIVPIWKDKHKKIVSKLADDLLLSWKYYITASTESNSHDTTYAIW